ncbi:MAG: hypothetical protein K0A89_09005 [ANME-2 cluster archaeon]|nr:hypothetical protein [ANME-2 cluster archaeon]
MTEFESDRARVKMPKGYRMSVIKRYFWVGLISALLLRLVIIADHYGDIYARVLRYRGVSGYLWFFAHRYHIGKRRSGVIKDLELLEKIERREPFTEEDFEGLNYVMRSLSMSRERMNYLVIFAFSVIAIMLSPALDFRTTGL